MIEVTDEIPDMDYFVVRVDGQYHLSSEADGLQSNCCRYHSACWRPVKEAKTVDAP